MPATYVFSALYVTFFNTGSMGVVQQEEDRPMTRRIAAAAWMAFACCPANAQPADSLPAFEVASVKLAPPEAPGHHNAHSFGGPGTASPGQWTCSNYNLPEL